MNELITWNEAYSLGVVEIDVQHKKMFSIINRLYSAMQAATEKTELAIILGELAAYADYHFSTEEKYFEEFDYDEKEAHIKAHNVYIDKVTEFLREYNSKENTAVLSVKILDFLKEWWTGHILGEDRGYVDCFHEHGLK